MKKAILCLFLVAGFAGCSGSEISDPQFKAVWQRYLSKLFEESFDQKQSSAQRQKMLQDAARDYGIDYQSVVQYLETKEPDKLKSVF
jgi:predicted DsbA family dithiol-disulfide isomerase